MPSFHLSIFYYNYPGSEVVLPVGNGKWGVSENGSSQSLSIYLSDEVPTPTVENYPSLCGS